MEPAKDAPSCIRTDFAPEARGVDQVHVDCLRGSWPAEPRIPPPRWRGHVRWQIGSILALNLSQQVSRSYRETCLEAYV